jgi:hypothetical protein
VVWESGQYAAAAILSKLTNSFRGTGPSLNNLMVVMKPEVPSPPSQKTIIRSCHELVEPGPHFTPYFSEILVNTGCDRETGDYENAAFS